MKTEPKLPAIYESLDEGQQKGIGAIPDLPEVHWVADFGVAHTPPTGAVYIPADARARCAVRDHPAPRILRTWRDLAKAGYIPTTKRNYQATLKRLRGGGQPLREATA